METGSSGTRIADLHKSAFWIYGVTAMVMREPFASVIRHISTAGTEDWQVRLEVFRIVVVLVLMARLFLASGLYFDAVYMRPESAAKYPKRSYATDFLSGLLQFLLIVAASTAVALHPRLSGGLSIFLLLTAAFLLSEVVWLALALALEYSSTQQIARSAKFNGALLIAGTLAGGGMRLGGADPVLAEQIVLGLWLAAVLIHIAKLVREYDTSGN